MESSDALRLFITEPVLQQRLAKLIVSSASGTQLWRICTRAFRRARLPVTIRMSW